MGRGFDASDAMYDARAPCHCSVDARSLLVFVKGGAYHTLSTFCAHITCHICGVGGKEAKVISYPGLQKWPRLTERWFAGDPLRRRHDNISTSRRPAKGDS